MAETHEAKRSAVTSATGLPAAIAGAGGLALLLAWMPRGAAELWPARAGDLREAWSLVGCAAAVAFLVGVAGLRARALALVAGGPLLALAVLGVPAILPVGALPGLVVGAPVHGLLALLGGFGLARLATRSGSGAALPVLGLLGLALVAATAQRVRTAVTADLPPLVGEVVELSLLDRPDLREVVREDPERPVRVTSFAANRLTQLDSGTLPLLELPPNAEVRIRIPPTEPGAVLRLAAGISEDSYTSEARTPVRLEAVFEGQPALIANLTTWKGAAARRRTWQRAELPVAAGGTLVLRSQYGGPASEAPRAGFGLLEVVRPLEARRSLATRAEPNAVLVVIDTLRADRLGTYGNERPASPGLDSLAAEGTVFETAYSAASWTWPSTASLLTALTPPEHGVLDQTACYLSESLVSLAEVFQASGFTTAAFSGNPLVSAEKNFDKGFESFAQYHWDPAGVLLDDARAWLEANGTYRFFLYIHLTDPHAPYEPEAPFAESLGLPAPAGYSEPLHKQLMDGLRAGDAIDRAQLERHSEYLSSLYDGEVATTDRALTDFLRGLDDLGIGDRTVVAVTSDHGEEFLEHGMMGHGRQIFRESVHVPLFLRGPGVPAGRRVAIPVENRFLGPTLLELCGLTPRGNLAGRPDLLDAGDLELQGTQPIFFGSDLGWWPGEGSRILRAVLHEGRLFLWSPPRFEHEQELFALYDLAEDPAAGRDVADERPEELAHYHDLVLGWLAEAESVRPTVFDGGDEVRQMLLDLGYIGDE